MEQFVFREFMKHEVVQKSKIFANAFHLKITGWRPANTKEHPYRMNFYCDNLLVGYIDAEVDSNLTEFVACEMPFTLYTPFGRLRGTLQQHSGIFSYHLFYPNSLEKIDGTFTVERTYPSSKYDVTSIIWKEDLQGVRTKLLLGEEDKILEMQKCEKGQCEVVTISLLEKEKVQQEHIIYSNAKSKTLSSIILEGQEDAVIADVTFANGKTIKKRIPKYHVEHDYAPEWLSILILGTQDLEKDIIANDERLYDFMDEVDDTFTFSANGGKPISFFEQMGGAYCFGIAHPTIMFPMRKSNTEIAIEQKLLLERSGQ